MDKCTNCKGKHSSEAELEKYKKVLESSNEATEAIDKFIGMAPTIGVESSTIDKAKAAKKEIETNRKIIEQKIRMLEAPTVDDDEDEPEGDNEDY